MKWTFLPFFSALFLLGACEDNPFFGTDKIPERELTGTVSLEFSEDQSAVYVWLEGTELITQTDENGDFTMPLPTPSEQGTGSIVTGSYKLYFYLANYRLEYVTIEFLNGEVVEDLSTISKTGELKRIVSLKNILTLESEINPQSYNLIEDDSITINVKLIPNTSGVFITSIVKVYPQNHIVRTGYLIFNENQKLIQSIDIDGSRKKREAVMSPKKEWMAQFPLKKSLYSSKGEYNIIPYIVVDRSDVPPKLESLIAPNHKLFDQNFIMYPLKRTGSKLVIQ
ncbi:MAG: hypothetical protein ISR82_01555 [Candidatus Marinimicrobia bacterium]|nr:hypothetical protein [Candidatus Neomarinimicrobiota bacterium]MBL7009892.1 hypothetical protein [Candidatus Neomarinimicrobiota bacterium]MBL7030157.1 hypothetical protein [Candidatus Neomarinimicrobiota bacterium]